MPRDASLIAAAEPEGLSRDCQDVRHVTCRPDRKEIRDAAGLSADLKAKLTREIIDHEGAHGQYTKTFVKKIRKQLRS